MKKLLLTFALSISVFAGNVPQTELDKVNKFITTLLGDTSQMLEVSITEASRSNSTKLLSEVNVEANVMNFAKVGLKLKTKDKNIIISASISGKASDVGLRAEDILEMAAEAQRLVDAINKKGDYHASMALKGSNEGTSITFQMEPTAQNEDPSIQKLSLEGYLPNDADQEVRISLKGELRSAAGNVAIVRTSLTNIFNSLASEETPKDEDFEAIAKVIFEAMKELGNLEE